MLRLLCVCVVCVTGSLYGDTPHFYHHKLTEGQTVSVKTAEGNKAASSAGFFINLMANV